MISNLCTFLRHLVDIWFGCMFLKTKKETCYKSACQVSYSKGVDKGGERVLGAQAPSVFMKL